MAPKVDSDMLDGVQSDFFGVTLRMLEDVNKTLKEIARETDIPYPWLRNIARGETKDPGIHRLEILHRYLYFQLLEEAWEKRRFCGIKKVTVDDLDWWERFPYLTGDPILEDPHAK